MLCKDDFLFIFFLSFKLYEELPCTLNLREIQHQLWFKFVIVEIINNVIGVKNNTSVKEQVYPKGPAWVLAAFRSLA